MFIDLRLVRFEFKEEVLDLFADRTKIVVDHNASIDFIPDVGF